MYGVLRRRRSPISAWGCFNPREPCHWSYNAEGVAKASKSVIVHERFQRSESSPLVYLGLQQPQAEISERLRRICQTL